MKKLIERINKEIRENTIQIVMAENESDAGKQGMHLLNPTESELYEAVYQAERDLFTVVYVHTEKTWPGVAK